MKKYWMVHRPGTACSYMHTSFDAAVTEARRLHAQSGQAFAIVEAVGTIGESAELPRLEAHTPDDGEDAPY